jgi:hypothetical protein
VDRTGGGEEGEGEKHLDELVELLDVLLPRVAVE